MDDLFQAMFDEESTDTPTLDEQKAEALFIWEALVIADDWGCAI